MLCSAVILSFLGGSVCFICSSLLYVILLSFYSRHHNMLLTLNDDITICSLWICNTFSVLSLIQVYMYNSVFIYIIICTDCTAIDITCVCYLHDVLLVDHVLSVVLIYMDIILSQIYLCHCPVHYYITTSSLRQIIGGWAIACHYAELFLWVRCRSECMVCVSYLQCLYPVKFHNLLWSVCHWELECLTRLSLELRSLFILCTSFVAFI